MNNNFDKLLEFEQIINENNYAKSIEKINSLKIDDEILDEKEYFLGCIYYKKKDEFRALQHFLRANSIKGVHLKASKLAIKILFKKGFIRESKKLFDQISFKIKDQISTNFESFVKNEIEIYPHNSVIAIHQPSYLGWLGYFHKIYYSDKFVIHDAAQFSKNSFFKRVLIKKGNTNETTYLTIPAKKHSDFCLIKDIYTNENTDWRSEHLRKIDSAYRKSTFFKELFPFIISIFDKTRNSSLILEITNIFTTDILKLLEIERKVFFSSQIEQKEIFENPHDRNMDICLKVNGSIYLSGIIAKDYQDGKKTPQQIRLIYQDFFKYIQMHPYLRINKFINGLSILDALFHVGPEKILSIFKSYEDPINQLVLNPQFNS